MRIVHVVTLATPDNVYGGPVRVAAGQVAELVARGHDATLVASAPPGLVHSVEYLGAPFHGFPLRRTPLVPGYAGYRAHGLIDWLRSRGGEADVVHVHLARDLVTLPAVLAAQRQGIPTVVQTHGMIAPRADFAARVLDAFATRRALRGAGALLALNEEERRRLSQVAPTAPDAVVVPNGIRLESSATPARPGLRAEVLFLSRLHPRKRPDAFVRAASLVVVPGAAPVFSVLGPDEGALDAVRTEAARATADVRIEGAIPPDAVAARMALADVFVLPAVDEPFGMVVLEAMAAGTPVVVTRSCGLAPDVEREGAGVVVDGSDASIAEAVQMLLEDPAMRARMGDAGRALAARYSLSGVVDTLEELYSRAALGRP